MKKVGQSRALEPRDYFSGVGIACTDIELIHFERVEAILRLLVECSRNLVGSELRDCS